MGFFTKARVVSFVWLFCVEAPLACAFMRWMYSNNEDATPATTTAKLVWVAQHLFLLTFPSFLYLWGAMRAFDDDTDAEDPFAGKESQRWKKFQKQVPNPPACSGAHGHLQLTLMTSVQDSHQQHGAVLYLHPGDHFPRGARPGRALAPRADLPG